MGLRGRPRRQLRSTGGKSLRGSRSLRLHFECGCTQRQIALACGLSPPTVCDYVRRASYDTYTWDTFRVRNGKLVEHWDGATLPAATPAGTN